MGSSELQHCLAHSGSKALIQHGSLGDRSGDVLSDRRLIVPEGSASADSSWAKALSGDRLEGGFSPAPDDTAIVMYTGGTTGAPKGVRHLYGRMAQNLLAHVICGDLRSDERMLLTTPLPHSAGFHLQACLLQGGRVTLRRRFDPSEVLSRAQAGEATWTFLVPTMLYRILDLPDRPSVARLPRTVVYGAAPMNPLRLNEALDAFGPVFIQLYGQTECPNYISTLTKRDHLDPALRGSAGRAVPFAEIRIRAEAPGEAGEVDVRSPYLLADYAGDPESTVQALRDGWLATGDVGRLDAGGYLHLLDRKKDMIISGGMNVYSADVEAALYRHTAVAEAAVVGVPDPDWGEAVIAIVVPRGPVEPDEIRSFLKREISAYKVPKQVRLVSALPRTVYGKIDKKTIRAELLAGAD